MKRALSLLLLAVPVAVLAQVQFMQDGTNVNAPAKRVNCSGGVTCSPLGRDGVTLTASGSSGGYDGGKVAEAYMADACITCQTATTAGYASTADTATSFATDPSDCEPGWYATGIDKFGNLTCSAVASGAASGASTTISLTDTGVFSASLGGLTWVTATTKIVCGLYEGTSTGLTPELVAAANLTVSVSSIVVGDGFVVSVSNPYGLVGTVTIHCIGV